ncbi:MAG: hypothetical protein F6K10_36740 [Moorea sp. SIO2B7]|nr:hypothetical protein [Moorena sp. SIO2B7]
MDEKGIPRYKCYSEIPGRLPKCQDCKYFQSFLPLVKEKARSLDGLSISELEQLLEELGEGMNWEGSQRSCHVG